MLTPEPAPQTATLIYPAPKSLAALRELVDLGYYRGILNKLDEIESSEPSCADFVLAMRTLARQFRFEAMSEQLNGASHEN